jgi:hypothetical protein
MKSIKQLVEEAITDTHEKLLHENLLDEDDQLEDEIGVTDEGFGEIEEDEDSKNHIQGLFSLAQLPIREWGGIRVSPKSIFGANRWDFTDYPLPHPDRGIATFNSKDNGILDEHWILIAKALTFYMIPHFSVTDRMGSYSSMVSHSIMFRDIWPLFKRYNIYQGREESSSFRTIDCLTRDEVIAWIDGLESLARKCSMAYALRHWQRVSMLGLLPSAYMCRTIFITKEDTARYTKQRMEGAISWTPIPLDNYAALCGYCFKAVSEYAKDALFLYKTFYRSLVHAFDGDPKLEFRPGSHHTNSKAGIKAFKSYQPVTEKGMPWWGLQVRQYVDQTYEGEYLRHTTVRSTVFHVIHAAIVIILCTTGMRRSELCGLKTGSLWSDKEGFWLNFTVFKTSPTSQGDLKRIPVPDITVAAIRFLEEIGDDSRTFGGHDYLLTSLVGHTFGNRLRTASVGTSIETICDWIGVPSVHPHQFRKSLASYIIYQDPRAIALIKHLYSHSSYKMTLRYILLLPAVHTEILQIMIEENTAILADVIESALQHKIGGPAGKRLEVALDKSPGFAATLMDNGKETLEQYVEAMLQQGAALLHRTNFAICMRGPGVTEKSPCDPKLKRPNVISMPNLAMCDPLSCHHSAFLPEHIEDLKHTIKTHQMWALHPYVDEKQKVFSERQIREAFNVLADLDEEGAQQFMKEVVNG